MNYSKVVKLIIGSVLWQLSSYIVFAQPIGIENCGASCYMNAVIQSVYTLPQLNMFIYAHDDYYEPGSLAKAYSNLTKLINIYQAGLDNCLIDDECVETLQKLGVYDTVQQQRKKSRPVIPVDVIDSIFYQYVKELFPIMGAQQDAEEFLTRFINSFIEDAQSPAQKRAASDFISALFKSHIVYTRTCKKSRYQLEEPTTLNIISLPIQLETGGKCMSLQTCLDDSFAPKELTGKEQVRCPLSGQKEDAVETKKFINVPEVLILQFQRVVFNRSLKRAERVATGVTIPLEGLRLYKYGAPRKYIYELIAIVCQQGTAGAGHYIAYVKSGGIWYRCNDDKIVERDLSTMKNLETHGIVDVNDSYYNEFVPYFLFYKRREIPDDIVLQEQLAELTTDLVSLKLMMS